MLKCIVCGSAIEQNRTKNHKYCHDCHRVKQREWTKQWKKRNGTKRKASKRRWWHRHQNTRVLKNGILGCQMCGSNLLIDIWNDGVHCGDCGSRIMVAKENKNYSIPYEPVCVDCGVVYQIPSFSVWGGFRFGVHPFFIFFLGTPKKECLDFFLGFRSKISESI